MNLLLFLEFCLDKIDTWPTTVIRFLFLDYPSPATIMKVSAFFYGNGVPLRIAGYFYNLCNENGGVHVILAVFNFYSVWHSEKYTPHHAKYYNTLHKKFMWINGKYRPQLEPLLPDVSDIPLVLDGTGHNEIRNKFELMRKVECSLELLS